MAAGANTLEALLLANLLPSRDADCQTLAGVLVRMVEMSMDSGTLAHCDGLRGGESRELVTFLYQCSELFAVVRNVILKLGPRSVLVRDHPNVVAFSAVVEVAGVLGIARSGTELYEAGKSKWRLRLISYQVELAV